MTLDIEALKELAGRATEVSPLEYAVLEMISGGDEFEWIADTFKGLARQVGAPLEDVAAACRALRAKGLARPERGLMTEDGDFVGSGYTATPAGRHLYWNMPPRAALSPTPPADKEG